MPCRNITEDKTIILSSHGLSRYTWQISCKHGNKLKKIIYFVGTIDISKYILKMGEHFGQFE